MLKLKSLKFSLPEKPFGNLSQKMSELKEELIALQKGAGTESDKFRLTFEKVESAVIYDHRIENVIQTKTDVRALALLMSSQTSKKLKVNRSLLKKILDICIKPTSLFIESLYQFFLNNYYNISDLADVSSWLVKARKARGISLPTDEYLLSENGANWLAQLAEQNNVDFDLQVTRLGLDMYSGGEFLEHARKIYYVESLKNIPLNQPHHLLIEVQKESVYRAPYTSDSLLGNEILSILISRAPQYDIHDSWLNAIMAIGGDPRIPKNHQRYIQWWRSLPSEYVNKVVSWLSGFDLKLFLDALNDYAATSHKGDLKSMYPARKRFLEGLLEKKLIKRTRLYLNTGMASYLKTNYKREHLPDFSYVSSSDKSLIYVDLGDAHMIEGSHSCFLWIYRKLHDSAVVFDYEKKSLAYAQLTSGLDGNMYQYGCGSVANITHNNNWQRKAVNTLNELGIELSLSDVMHHDDYMNTIRHYGYQ